VADDAEQADDDVAGPMVISDGGASDGGISDGGVSVFHLGP
jgi:hypothetical protein